MGYFLFGSTYPHLVGCSQIKKISHLITSNPCSQITSNPQWECSNTTITSTCHYLVVMHYYTWLFKYCEIYDLLLCFNILLKWLIVMLFIDILLLFLYEVYSYIYELSPRVESMKLSSLITLFIAKNSNCTSVSDAILPPKGIG